MSVRSSLAVRVMVVDDTDHVRNMLVDMLELDGFEVVGQAASGEEAVATGRRRPTPTSSSWTTRCPGWTA